MDSRKKTAIGLGIAVVAAGVVGAIAAQLSPPEQPPPAPNPPVAVSPAPSPSPLPTSTATPTPTQSPTPVPTTQPLKPETPNRPSDGAGLEQSDLACRGTIGDDLVFKVKYSAEHGFTPVQFFRPNSEDVMAEAPLSYSGKNDKGQSIFRGSVNNMADVTLVSLTSANQVQSGDAVSVGYDGRWGRGTCS